MQQVPWWGWTGGIIALFTITANILLFKAIGQLQTMVLPLFGQLLFSLAIDHYGLFSARVIPLSLLRFVGMAISVALLLGQLTLSLGMEPPGSPSALHNYSASS